MAQLDVNTSAVVDLPKAIHATRLTRRSEHGRVRGRRRGAAAAVRHELVGVQVLELRQIRAAHVELNTE